MSVAVDLIPDLDGTSSQQLTHDFGEPDWPEERDISWIIGLGVAAALQRSLRPEVALASPYRPSPDGPAHG